MSLREQIKQKSAEYAGTTKDVTLPHCGLVVRIRGLSLGDLRRVQAVEGTKATATEIALVAIDPSTGGPIWNPNSLDDHNEIAAIHPLDANAILSTSHRLAGLDKGTEAEAERKNDSAEERDSDSSSPSEWDSPRPSLTAA